MKSTRTDINDLATAKIELASILDEIKELYVKERDVLIRMSELKAKERFKFPLGDEYIPYGEITLVRYYDQEGLNITGYGLTTPAINYVCRIKGIELLDEIGAPHDNGEIIAHGTQYITFIHKFKNGVGIGITSEDEDHAALAYTISRKMVVEISNAPN
jgi:hypothetical protein